MSAINHLGFWEPEEGKSFKELKANCLTPEDAGGKGMSKKEVLTLTEESKTILGKCIHPTLKNSVRTGLVIGNIQSGKTLSFSAISCLAKDNNIKIIIIISGTKTNLFDQTKKRILNDIIGRDQDWTARTSKEMGADSSYDLKKLLNYEGSALLISCLKNKSQITKITEFINNSDFNFSTLIIDDESDQAGLNTQASKNNNKESSTYKSILNLRRAFKSHTYLKYTATPEADLLIKRDDELSPDFVELISPGSKYTGIKEFFNSTITSKIIKEIPPKPDPYDEKIMPDTLKEAVLVYLIGLCDGEIKRNKKEKLDNSNRTMYVHPDRIKNVHTIYETFIKRYLEIINEGIENNNEKQTVDELTNAYSDLKSTCTNLEGFEKILEIMPKMITKLKLHVWSYNMQTNKQFFNNYEEFPWNKNYGWILIGGDLLERGFTVKDCTSCYMPRVAKKNNQDTVIQRGRFLGYRNSFLNYCRVYLDYDIKNLFENYQTSIDQQIFKVKEFNKRQKEFGMELNFRNESRLLSIYRDKTRPTRRNILSKAPKLIDVGGWNYAKFPEEISDKDLDRNRLIYDAIDSKLEKYNFGLAEFLELKNDKNNKSLKEWSKERIKPKYSFNYPGAEFLQELKNFTFSNNSDDKAQQQHLIFYLTKEFKNKMFSIIKMTAEERSVYNENGLPIFRPFAGPDEIKKNQTFLGYPGDVAINSPINPTVLIYKLNLRQKPSDNKKFIKTNVPVIVINFPKTTSSIGVYN